MLSLSLKYPTLEGNKVVFTKALQQSQSSYSLKQQDVSPLCITVPSHYVTNCSMLVETSYCKYVYNSLTHSISLVAL